MPWPMVDCARICGVGGPQLERRAPLPEPLRPRLLPGELPSVERPGASLAPGPGGWAWALCTGLPGTAARATAAATHAYPLVAPQPPAAEAPASGQPGCARYQG